MSQPTTLDATHTGFTKNQIIWVRVPGGDAWVMAKFTGYAYSSSAPRRGASRIKIGVYAYRNGMLGADKELFAWKDVTENPLE